MEHIPAEYAAAADAQLLYDFLRMPTSPPPTKADAILVLGSNDMRVAKRAAELHAAGLAPLVVFSGARRGFTIFKRFCFKTQVS